MVAQDVLLVHGRWRAGDQEFKVILDHLSSSRQAWSTWDPDSKMKSQETGEGGKETVSGTGKKMTYWPRWGAPHIPGHEIEVTFQAGRERQRTYTLQNPTVAAEAEKSHTADGLAC